MNFFAPQGSCPSAGVFSAAHVIYVIITCALIILPVYFTVKFKPSSRERVIRIIAIALIILETLKIVTHFLTNEEPNPNSYLPFYFCSIEIYASFLAAFTRGRLKRLGEVFMMTGGIIGSILFMIYPASPLKLHPPFHFMNIISFLYHGIMLYAGILMYLTKTPPLRMKDIGYHIAAVLSVSAIALYFNLKLGTNLMFLSQNFPGTFIEPLYNAMPLPVFTTLSALIQSTMPFLAVFGINKAIITYKNKKTK